MSNNITTTQEILDALDNFLDVVSGMDMGPLDHFTCTEVESLARLVLAARGEEAAVRVIVYHFFDSSEEHDELAEHLGNWPTLRAEIRSTFSEGCEIQLILNELEEEGR